MAFTNMPRATFFRRVCPSLLPRPTLRGRFLWVEVLDFESLLISLKYGKHGQAYARNKKGDLAMGAVNFKEKIIVLDGEEYWPVLSTAKKLNLSWRTLYRLEQLRQGPPITKIANTRYYRKSAVTEWLLNQETNKGRRRHAA
jgi:hypothetical protein